MSLCWDDGACADGCVGGVLVRTDDAGSSSDMGPAPARVEGVAGPGHAERRSACGSREFPDEVSARIETVEIAH